MDRDNLTEWVFEKTKQNKTKQKQKQNKKKNACFQGSHFAYVGEGEEVVMVVCVGGSVGVLMRCVWRSLGVRMVLFEWGWGCVWRCG